MHKFYLYNLKLKCKKLTPSYISMFIYYDKQTGNKVKLPNDTVQGNNKTQFCIYIV